jgi:hypothetical protein
VRKFLALGCFIIALVSCEYTEEKREVGYKGKALTNPWLAAERFCAARSGEEVRSVLSWQSLDWNDSLCIMPASILSNESFVRQTEDWVAGGGHLVLLIENADAGTSDWSTSELQPTLDEPVIGMLDRVGITFESEKNSSATKIELGGESFNVMADSQTSVRHNGEESGVFASVESGDGRVTALTDSRIFRNRWIADHDHAGLLEQLIGISEFSGNIVFIRGSSLSLWSLLVKHLWAVLLALGVVLVLWLWKNFTRFGPLEASEGPAVLRGYDHHLEALGDFQWRVDRAAGLLAPLRAQILERGQRVATRAGRRDDDFFQFLADRAQISRERVHRALVEAAPADAAILTRTTADLQLLLQVLH